MTDDAFPSSEGHHYTIYAAYSAPAAAGTPAGDPQAAAQASAALTGTADVTLRGAYHLTGFRAEADLLLWVTGHSAETAGHDRRVPPHRVRPQPRPLLERDRRAPRRRVQPRARPGVPGRGEPHTYLCMYPYVRSLEWYLLPDEERRDMLAEHGRWAATTPTCARTPSARSPSATTSGCWRSRPTSSPHRRRHAPPALRPGPRPHARGAAVPHRHPQAARGDRDRDRLRRGALPAHVVPLHDAVALGQLDVARQRPGERAERLAVVADEELQVVAARALGLGGEAQLRPAVVRREADAVEVAREASRGRSRCATPSTHTVRSLCGGASCTPVTRFHATARPSIAVPTPADQRHAVSRAW